MSFVNMVTGQSIENVLGYFNTREVHLPASCRWNHIVDAIRVIRIVVMYNCTYVAVHFAMFSGNAGLL